MLTRHGRGAGFTLIEVVVTMGIFAMLVALTVPSMGQWVKNTKIRSVADSLQNGLRLAQSESLRRSRQVVFSLTNSTAPQTSLTAVANGTNWSVNTIAGMAPEVGAFVEAGVLATTGSGVTVTGPAEICFNSIGRLVLNSSTGVTGGTCGPSTTTPAWTYNVSVPNAVAGQDRPLNVTVALGGQIHMCDPAVTLSSTNPEGC